MKNKKIVVSIGNIDDDEKVFDTGMTEEEWNALPDDKKEELVVRFLFDHMVSFSWWEFYTLP